MARRKLTGQLDRIEPSKAGKWRWPKPTLSLSAFIMSLTITLFNAYYALRGADIVVLPKAEMLFYRDGEGEASVLAAAVPLSMINAADGYGDVILDASVTMADGARFAWQGQVTPVMFADPQNAASKCPVDARCTTLNGLTLIQHPDDIPDLPAGGARRRTFAFPITASNCKGPAKACAQYGGFDQAVAMIAAKPLSVTIRIDFNADGHRTLECTAGKLSGAYLAKIGWSSMACQTVTVKGRGWL